MNRSLNVAIIGCGYATVTFHAPLIQSVPGLSLVAVSSSDRAKAEASLPGADVCDSPEQFVVVVAGGPTSLHCAYLPSFGATDLQSQVVVTAN